MANLTFGSLKLMATTNLTMRLTAGAVTTETVGALAYQEVDIAKLKQGKREANYEQYHS